MFESTMPDAWAVVELKLMAGADDDNLHSQNPT
jgi:hypothetical protein